MFLVNLNYHPDKPNISMEVMALPKVGCPFYYSENDSEGNIMFSLLGIVQNVESYVICTLKTRSIKLWGRTIWQTKVKIYKYWGKIYLQDVKEKDHNRPDRDSKGVNPAP